MSKQEIDNIRIELLKLSDYEELKTIMIASYASMPDSYWREAKIEKLISIFPEGQVVVKVNNQMAACALSIVVDYNQLNNGYRVKSNENLFLALQKNHE